jgi:hypothetical protein
MSETDTQAAPAQDPAQDTSAGQGAQGEASELTQEAPEASQGEQTDVKAEDTAEAKLLAGKYKTVEELEKAYSELHSEYGRTTSEKAELQRILNEAFTPPADNADTGYDDEQEVSTPAGDDKTQRDVSVLKFTIAHPDADGTLMNEVLAKDPNVKYIKGYEAKLEYAYAQSQVQKMKNLMAEAKKQGAAEAQAKTAEKEAAQVETGKRTEPVDEQAELLDKAKNGTPEERKAARLALIRKNLVNL